MTYEQDVTRLQLEIKQQKELMDASGGDLAGYVSVFQKRGEYSTVRLVEFAETLYDADYERLCELENRLALIMIRGNY